MRIVRSAASGFLRMSQNTGLVLALWLVALLSALPLAVVLEDTIRSDIGSSLMHRSLRQGLDLGWLEEFHHRRGGLADTLEPVRVSPAFVFENLELWANSGWLAENRALAAAAGAFLLIWLLLQGGVITQLASPELRFRWSTLLAAGGTYFLRFLRLAGLLGVAYYGVYRLGLWLFPAIDRWTIDVTVERTVLGLHLLAFAALGLMMVVLHLVAEYAKIATVREQRRSMVLALWHALRLLARHPLQALGLYGILLAALAALQALYYWTAPGVSGASPLSVILVLAVGQLYLVLRWAIRVVRWGAEIDIYDRWTAPMPVSPAAATDRASVDGRE